MAGRVSRVDADEAKWAELRALRAKVTEAIEPLRREKVLGSSLEAEVWVAEHRRPDFLAELCIASTVRKGDWKVVKTRTANAAVAGGSCPKSCRTATLRPLRGGVAWLKNAVRQLANA